MPYSDQNSSDISYSGFSDGAWQNSASRRPVRSLSVRWYLILLVVGSLAPVILFAVGVVQQLLTKEKIAADRRLVAAARELSALVDHELSSTTRTLQALAASQALDRNDLKNFAVEIKRVSKNQPTWETVILLAPNGREIVNSSQALGARLSSANEPESLKYLLATRRPTVGSLTIGKNRGRWSFPIRVPVLRGGKVKYVLSAVLTPAVLTKTITGGAMTEGEWTRSVVDNHGIVLARSRDPHRFIGKRATANYINQIKNNSIGVFASTTLDGVAVRTAYHRLQTARWTASVSVPRAILEAPGRRAITAILTLGSILLLVSTLGAYFVSRHIAGAMASAAIAAGALARGDLPSVHHRGILEMAILEQALTHSAQLLAQREHDLQLHVQQAEQARDEAESANRFKDYFLATLSHEIRSPLTAILGLACLLRTEKLDTQMRVSSLETIERNARSLSRLVGDLLDMSRINAGKLHLEIQETDLTQVVNNALENVRPLAKEKGVQIKTDLKSVGLIDGDADRLQQIVWNLLSNAVKFTPTEGWVAVRIYELVSDDGAQAVMEVSDSGIGIEAELLPYIFDRFRQGDGSNTRKFGGLGLGLAIVHDLVEMHRGTVTVKSAGAGQGTTFTVFLPLHPGATQADKLPG